MDSDCLAHYLKIWADAYDATGEIKGGTVPLTFMKFIVTSNFEPHELFKNEKILEAIERRFEMKRFCVIDRVVV